MSQIALPLGWPADPRDDVFLIGPSNARPVHLLDQWQGWPVKAALLTGPRRSGRSLLARVFAARSGGSVVDDAGRLPEAALFHAWNRAQGEGRPLLIVADAPPPDWAIALPDLRSRIAATPHAAIDAPDDDLMRALLARLFEQRHLVAPADLVDWLAARIERSHAAVERIVDALDRQAMERRRRLSIPLARATLTAARLIAPANLPED